jgi:hypothetical protein
MNRGPATARRIGLPMNGESLSQTRKGNKWSWDLRTAYVVMNECRGSLPKANSSTPHRSHFKSVLFNRDLADREISIRCSNEIAAGRIFYGSGRARCEGELIDSNAMTALRMAMTATGDLVGVRCITSC